MNAVDLPVEIPAVAPIADAALEQRLRRCIDAKTKPPGALGRLETLALQIGLVLRNEAPVFERPQLLVFAADHGLAAQGVSAYPQAVTAQIAHNILDGGAAISVFARQFELELTLVDAGIVQPVPPHPRLRSRRVRAGSRDASIEAALTAEECAQALRVGRDVVRELPGNVVLLGELGIANTSSAALLLSRLGDVPLAEAVGRGTGLDDAGLRHKREVLEHAAARHAEAATPLAALTAFGGLEIAMMTGAALQAAHERRLIVADGFVVGAALLVARALAPAVTDYCVFAHRGAEAGHAAMLERLDAHPLLELELRLGEGSGAALAWPLVDAAARMLAGMASFESAGVSGRER